MTSPSPSETFFYRGLTWDEYDQILLDETTSQYLKEELVVKAALLWPEDTEIDELDELVGGLAQAILEASYFYSSEDAQNLLDAKREETKTARHTMKVVVLACYDFLGLREKDIDAMTFEQLCEKVVLSEKIIELHKMAFSPETLAVPQINFITPEDEEEEEVSYEQRSYGLSSHDPEGHEGTNPDRPTGGVLADDPIARKLRQTLQ